MKVLYFHQFFNTPADGGNIRSYYMTQGLIQRGHEVHIITSHQGKEEIIKEIDGSTVTYLPIDYENEYGFWKRIKAYVGFAWKASLASRKVKNVDLCYVMTTPLTMGFIGLFNKWLLKRPYIFEVGDLWPWVPIEMGVIRNDLLKTILYAFEKLFYQQAKGNIGLSPPITAYIQKMAPNTQVETVYNVADCEYFKPQTADEALKSKYGIGNEFVITYTGTFGLANDLVRMVDIMKGVQHLPLKFLFIGMGAEKEDFKRAVEEAAITNCVTLDFQPKEAMKEILAVSDAMLISFANHQSLFTGSPNKLFDALAAGLLVMTNFDGWIKELIEAEGCGFAFQHDSDSDFENKIKAFLDDPELVKSGKEIARKLAEERFEWQLLSELQVRFLEELSK